MEMKGMMMDLVAFVRRWLSPRVFLALAAAATALPASGCCMLFGCNYKVLVRVDPNVETPKSMDIVWIFTEDPARATELETKFGGKMEDFFRTGRRNLSPAYYRFYRYRADSQLPLEVRPEPGASQEKFFGPFADAIPSGAVKGYLFVEYPNGEGDVEGGTKLPLLVYPTLPHYPNYSSAQPSGISVRISRDRIHVIPYELEAPLIIDQAERLKKAEEEAARVRSQPAAAKGN